MINIESYIISMFRNMTIKRHNILMLYLFIIMIIIRDTLIYSGVGFKGVPLSFTSVQFLTFTVLNVTVLSSISIS